jgi:hypothetical protein
MHYSLWKNDMKPFKEYWLHGNILGKIQDGKIILNAEFWTNIKNTISI